MQTNIKNTIKIICFTLTFNLLLDTCPAQEIPGTYRVTYQSKDKNTGQYFQAGGSAVAYEKIKDDRVKFLTAGHLFDDAQNHVVHMNNKTYNILKTGEYHSIFLKESLIEFETAYADVPIIPLAYYDPPVNAEVQFSGFPDSKPDTTKCTIKQHNQESHFFLTNPPLPTFGYSGGPVVHNGYVVGILSGFDDKSQVGVHINVSLKVLVSNKIKKK